MGVNASRAGASGEARSSTDGTPLSEVTVSVECPSCSPGREDDDLLPGSIKLHCVECKGEFFTANDADPLSTCTWESISASPLIDGFCFACDKPAKGQFFSRCSSCKSAATLMEKCSICWENCDVLKDMTALDGCMHRFCNDCWRDHCSTSIRQLKLTAHPASGFYTIECPDMNCHECAPDPHFIKQFVAPELYDRMKSYATENFAQLKLGAVACPVSSCGSVMIPSGKQKKVTCVDCKTPFCSQCKVPWHENMSCAQYTGRNDVDDESAVGSSKFFKNCPNEKCGVMIEELNFRAQKQEGCNYVKCSYCTHVFCWRCLKPWPSDPIILGRLTVPLHALNFQKPCDCPKWEDAKS